MPVPGSRTRVLQFSGPGLVPGPILKINRVRVLKVGSGSCTGSNFENLSGPGLVSGLDLVPGLVPGLDLVSGLEFFIVL